MHMGHGTQGARINSVHVTCILLYHHKFYLYSILVYTFFSNDFMIATNPMEHFTELRKMGECDAGKDLQHKHSVNYIISQDDLLWGGGGGGGFVTTVREARKNF